MQGARIESPAIAFASLFVCLQVIFPKCAEYVNFTNYNCYDNVINIAGIAEGASLNTYIMNIKVS